MEDKVRFLYLLVVLFLFTHCTRQETNNIDVVTNGITALYEENIEEWIFDGTSFRNRSPNIFNNVYYEFLANDNFITIDDPEFRIERLFLDGNISPIGWSVNGAFAYAQYIPSEFGASTSRVTVLSIISGENEHVDTSEDYDLQWAEAEDIRFFEPRSIPFNEFWETRHDDILELLRRHEIISFYDFALWNINTLEERFNLELIIEDGLPFFEGVGTFINVFQGKNMILQNEQGKRKTIALIGRLHFGQEDHFWDVGEHSVLDIIGYFECPFGNGIVFYFFDRVYTPITTPPFGRRTGRYVLRIGFQRLAWFNLQMADISTDIDTTNDRENYDHDTGIISGARQSQIGLMASHRMVGVIGWSSTGLFAYRATWEEPAVPASGYKLVIFDAVTNNEIVRDLFAWPEPPWHEPDDLPPSPETRLAETKTRWNELLSSYGIAGYVANPVEEIIEGKYKLLGGEEF